jgi:sodium-dependent dicarboxylate transporter 2/3/5
MAVYWMTEALPIPVTSLIPMVLFPLLGVCSTNEVGVNYLKSTNFMFIGGLILALAVEQSGLHTRVALRILLLIGTSPRNLLLGFMLTTGFLSMWISNTATTAMMIPIIDAIAQASSIEPDSDPETGGSGEGQVNAPLAIPDSSESFEDTEAMVEYKVVDQGSGKRPVVLQEIGKQPSKFFISETQKKAKTERQRNILLLAVAYSANIGGTGVITGSPPNLVVPQVMENRFGDATGLTFASWMAFAVPVMLVNLIISWVWISFIAWRQERQHRIPGDEAVDPKGKEAHILKVMRQKYEALGPVKCHELSVLICFATVIVLWFLRKPLFMAGWGGLFDYMTERGKKVTVGGATPAILMVLVVFALPTRYRFWPFQAFNKIPESSSSLISWKTIETKLPWGVIILLGGGFAVSDACTKSGLSAWLVQRLLVLVGLPPWLICVIVCVSTAALTQVASNTATANVLLPILADLSLTICQNPLYLIMAAAVTSSYAFMLPVATAPNAIVFGASTMTTSHMMKTGFGMNIITVITTLIAINTYAVPLYGLDLFPVWAEPQLPVNVTCH